MLLMSASAPFCFHRCPFLFLLPSALTVAQVCSCSLLLQLQLMSACATSSLFLLPSALTVAQVCSCSLLLQLQLMSACATSSLFLLPSAPILAYFCFWYRPFMLPTAFLHFHYKTSIPFSSSSASASFHFRHYFTFA
jgi:hypothetical protein